MPHGGVLPPPSMYAAFVAFQGRALPERPCVRLFCVSGRSRRIVSAGELVADARQGHVCDPFCVSPLGRYRLIAMHPGPYAPVSRRRVRPENPPRPAGSPDPACRGGPRCAPGFPVHEDVTQVQRVRQLKHCRQMPLVGPDALAPPPPYRQGVGLDAASDLRPRQPRLLPEPLQSPRKVVGEDVDPSAVVCALSRHRAGPSRIGDPSWRNPSPTTPLRDTGAGDENAPCSNGRLGPASSRRRSARSAPTGPSGPPTTTRSNRSNSRFCRCLKDLHWQLGTSDRQHAASSLGKMFCSIESIA